MTYSIYLTTFSAVVAQGQYPQVLLREWYKYDEERGSENYCPDSYGDEQLFIVILLENGGQDLEHFDLRSWSEAREIFKQTAKALAIGEQEVEFEVMTPLQLFISISNHYSAP